MRLLLTRPAEEGERSRRAFAAAGHSLLLAPVLEIEPTAAVPDFTGVQAIAVTSRRGLAALAAATGRRDLPLYAVGEGTAEAARAAGFQQVAVAEGDLAALARLLGAGIDPGAGSVLHAAGEILAGDLGEALQPYGITVVRTTLYRAREVGELPPMALSALRESKLDGVVFFSPRSAQVFARLVVRAGVQAACARLIAGCLSPAVARRAGALRWREIRVAALPNLPSLVAIMDTDGRQNERTDTETRPEEA